MWFKIQSAQYFSIGLRLDFGQNNFEFKSDVAANCDLYTGQFSDKKCLNRN